MTRAKSLPTELKVLAIRGTGRSFQWVQDEPPLDLSILFAIVERVCSDLWAGEEQEKIEAIKETIRRGLERMPADPLYESSIESSPATTHDAVLRLYELAEVPDEFKNLLQGKGRPYVKRVKILHAEARWQRHWGDLSKRTGEIRSDLAVALEGLLVPAPSPFVELASLKPEITDEPTPAATAPAPPPDATELVAKIKEYWASPTAYNEFDLDTTEGVRNMYRQLMDDAARTICLHHVSPDEVVATLRSNTARPDISGHDEDEMTQQVWLSAERLRRVLASDSEPEPVYGRVIDEQGNVVEGARQAAGSSIRSDKYGEVVGDGPNLISDSEIDAWLRGVLEHSEPAQIAAGTLDAIRVLAHYVRVRLERSVAWQQEAEQAASSEPNNVTVQQHLLLTERETKRQLTAVDALRQAMQQTSPAKVRCLAENVLWHDLSMGAAGNMNIEQLIERFRNDKEFRQYRHGGEK